MNPETVALALAISIGTNFAMLITWSWSRFRLRQVLRVDHICLNCGLPQRPAPDTFSSCPSCQRPGDRGEWLEL